MNNNSEDYLDRAVASTVQLYKELGISPPSPLQRAQLRAAFARDLEKQDIKANNRVGRLKRAKEERRKKREG